MPSAQLFLAARIQDNESLATVDVKGCEKTGWQRRSGAIYGIEGSFLFRNLHGHPRFESLLRRMNLT